MTNRPFRVCLEKDNLVFSAAHFITFSGNICESLHGHNYRVKCEIVGELDENGYVIDFIALRDALVKIVLTLDHHVLLPTLHSQIRVAEDDREVVVTFEEKRWVFPAEDCVLLPVANTTAELLADYIGQQLESACADAFHAGIQRMVVSVDENRGQWGVAEFQLAE
jgi:6-pyruvoyltetrahydropterin/6-carboxytetrahydropterin synthase